MSTPEGKVKDAIKKMLREEFPQVWTYWPVSNGMGAHGIPDLIMCAGGKFIAVEVKTTVGKLTPMQALQIERISLANGQAIVVYGEADVCMIRALLHMMDLTQVKKPPEGTHTVRIARSVYEQLRAEGRLDNNLIYMVTDQ